MDANTKAKAVNLEDLQSGLQKISNKGIANVGTCSTAAGTAAKAVTLGTTFELVTGTMILVKFSNDISVSNATLAVTHTTLAGTTVTESAKAIYHKGSALSANVIKAGSQVILRYNGTQFDIIGDVTNAPDEEDLTSINVGGTDVLKFKDKAYSPLTYSGMGRKILRKNIVEGVNTLTQDMFYKDGDNDTRVPNTNTIYVIQYDFDLNGQTITVPANCVLEFDGGSLRNGTLIGTDTQIRADKVAIFTGITIGGTWNVQRITSDWFVDAKTVDNTLQQIENLLSDSIYNEVTIEAGDYWFTHTEGRGHAFIINKPYTKIILIGNLRLRGTDYDDKKFVSINNTHDVELTGGGFIYGDKLTHIYADGNTYPDGTLPYYVSGMSTYETCHTLHIISSYNVTVDGINIRNSVGDGIDIIHDAPNKNYFVSIKNVTIENTRRQGITANTNCGVFENITIKGIHGTSPESGIDVEISSDQSQSENPRTSNEMIFRNICIEDCTTGFITRTATADIQNVSNILFEHIEVKNVVAGFHIYRLCDKVTIRNCNFEINLARYKGEKGGVRGAYTLYRNILAGDNCVIDGCNITTINNIPLEENVEGYDVYSVSFVDYGWSGEIPKNQYIRDTTIDCEQINALRYFTNVNMSGCYINTIAFYTDLNHNVSNVTGINIIDSDIRVNDRIVLNRSSIFNSTIIHRKYFEIGHACRIVGNFISLDPIIDSQTGQIEDWGTEPSWDISTYMFLITGTCNITSNRINVSKSVDALCVLSPFTAASDLTVPIFTNNIIQRFNYYARMCYIYDTGKIVMENNYFGNKKIPNYILQDDNLSGAILPIIASKGSTFIQEGNDRLLCKAQKRGNIEMQVSVQKNSSSFVANTLTKDVLYEAVINASKTTAYFSKVDSNPTDGDLVELCPSTTSGESINIINAVDPVVYPYIYLVNQHTSYQRQLYVYNIIEWCETDGAAAGVSRSGNGNRPNGSDIYVGFMYFDTSSGINKPIYASAISGDTVTWVDATGATV